MKPKEESDGDRNFRKTTFIQSKWSQNRGVLVRACDYCAPIAVTWRIRAIQRAPTQRWLHASGENARRENSLKRFHMNEMKRARVRYRPISVLWFAIRWHASVHSYGQVGISVKRGEFVRLKRDTLLSFTQSNGLLTQVPRTSLPDMNKDTTIRFECELSDRYFISSPYTK